MATNIKPIAMSKSELYQCALEHYNAGHFDRCEAVVRELLADHPDDAYSISLLGGVHLKTRGPTREAEELMRKAAQLEPGDLNLLNNLGAVCFAQGRYHQAGECFERITTVDSGHVDAWHNLGKVRRALGMPLEAEAAYRRALSLDARRPYIVNSLAGLLHARGRTDEAVGMLRAAIGRSIADAETFANLGLVLSAQARYPEAIEAYEQAIAVNPQKADHHANLGETYIRCRELAKAKTECRRAIMLDPSSMEAYNNLGVVLRDEGRYDQSLAALEVARNLKPELAGIHVNLGITLHDMERFAEACEALEQAISIDPEWLLAQINLASAYLKAERHEQALAAYNKALEMYNEDSEVGDGSYLSSIYTGRAYACMELGLWEEALAGLNAAIRQVPDHATVRFARAVALLRLGRLREGWRDYEWRFTSAKHGSVGTLDWDRPEWNGQPFKGKTLLVHHEQGLGDAIHFVRYLPRVKQLGGRVLLRCGPPLFRLFASMPAIDRMVSRRNQESSRYLEYDMQIPLVTLPHIFGTELDSVPDEVPYLSVDDSLVSKWAHRVVADRIKIGLAWEGNRDQGDNHMRSCTLSDFAPLARIPGIQFYSLQVGPASEQAKAPPAGMDLIDYTADLHDMAETGAFIRNLDLVITVDTSIAHLAGAIGHDVWTILWLNACWRYLLDRQDSPWYRTMRLFRQSARGDWSSVMRAVASELGHIIPRPGVNAPGTRLSTSDSS